MIIRFVQHSGRLSIAGGLVFLLLLAPGVLGQDQPTALDGNETHVPKPAPVAMPEPATIQQAIERGVQFLLADQNQDGSWGTPERTKDLNIFAPVPGAHHAFRTAVTSLCISALIEVNSTNPGVPAGDRPGRAVAV